MKKTAAAFLLLLLPVPHGAPRAEGVRDTVFVRGDPMYTVLDFDAIPAIDNPVFVTASEADSFLRPDEMVIGVHAGGEAKAYSTWHLDRHEIVNDVLGGTAIAATW